ncbi:MAG: signal peptidase II, partial [Planctomycetota bacterium]
MVHPHGSAHSVRLTRSDIRLRRVRLFATAVVILLVDQLTKIAAFKTIPMDTPHEVIPGVLWWTPRLNPGAAFSFLSSHAYGNVLLGVVSAGLAGLLYWYAEHHHRSAPGWAFGLVIGGALGNLLDRIVGTEAGGERIHGVRDFIDVGWWPTFNI